MSLKDRGLVTRGNRITIPKVMGRTLDIIEGDFYEAESYGKDKILLTFFKVGDRAIKGKP